MRLAVDAMGGDFAPSEPVRGAVAALELLEPDDELVLVGRPEAIERELTKLDGWKGRISIEPASQVIAMDESGPEAVRSKPDSSISRMAKLAADGQVDAVISAGNTSACVAASMMRMRRLPGVHRPGIAIVIPTLNGPVVVCDVGANIYCKPRNLYQYAVMSSIYSREVLGVANPTVGLLSIGEESVKGNPLVRETRRLLLEDPSLNFHGNVEGSDVFKGNCDVIVCEGFVGNVVLKLTEGLSEGLLKMFMQEVRNIDPSLVERMQPAFDRVWRLHDSNEYGGAPLLGVDGICIICHGATDARGIKNAIRVAREHAGHRVNERFVAQLRNGHV